MPSARRPINGDRDAALMGDAGGTGFTVVRRGARVRDFSDAGLLGGDGDGWNDPGRDTCDRDDLAVFRACALICLSSACVLRTATSRGRRSVAMSLRTLRDGVCADTRRGGNGPPRPGGDATTGWRGDPLALAPPRRSRCDCLSIRLALWSRIDDDAPADSKRGNAGAPACRSGANAGATTWDIVLSTGGPGTPGDAGLCVLRIACAVSSVRQRGWPPAGANAAAVMSCNRDRQLTAALSSLASSSYVAGGRWPVRVVGDHRTPTLGDTAAAVVPVERPALAGGVPTVVAGAAG